MTSKEFNFNNDYLNQTKILAIVGPTATGKSELALKLAKQIDGEIISADSMQVYRNLNIATAKPSKFELNEIEHHLINCADLNDDFSVVDFVKLASLALNEIVKKNKKPILVGGTGLYIDSFLNEISFNDFNQNNKIKLKILADLKNFGSAYLLEKLKKIDFEYAKKLHENNHRRIVRALEIYYSTGTTISEMEQKSKNKAKKLKYLKIGLNFLNRQILYEKINNRVDLMMEKGLLNEAMFVLKNCKNPNSTALQAIGYKEFKPYFSGTATLNECVLMLKKNTRRFAKRQLTWFRKSEYINWFSLDENSYEVNFQKILSLTENFFKNDD